MHDIKVGQEGNAQAVVLQGLSAGQKVVVAGQYRLQQGALVQPSQTGAPSPREEAAQNNSAKAP
jgi:multidrug efflux system membrane fusion protein